MGDIFNTKVGKTHNWIISIHYDPPPPKKTLPSKKITPPQNSAFKESISFSYVFNGRSLTISTMFKWSIQWLFLNKHSGIHQKPMAVLPMDRDQVLSGLTPLNVLDLRQVLSSVVTVAQDLIIVTMGKMSQSAVCLLLVRIYAFAN